jgi:nicotinamide-nucleotide amidase
VRVHIVTIGDELLIGQVIDTNSAKMAQALGDIGAQVTGRTAVGDEHSRIVAALRHALSLAQIVLVTGGLGPTKDDITKKGIAELFGVELRFDQPTYDRLEKMLSLAKRPMTDALRSQCWMPANAMILTNEMGTAPGMWFEDQGRVLVSMPGVPFELDYLMRHEVLPRLQQRFPSLPIVHHTLLTAGEGESVLAEHLKEFEEALPPNVKLAYLPAIARVRLRLTVTDEDRNRAQRILDEKFQKMRSLLPEEVVAGAGDESLENAVGKLLEQRGLTLGTAESCTGGYLAHLITSVPGSSTYFRGSIVAYDNRIKSSQLGVQERTLAEQGAVSEATVKEMIEGAIARLGVDVSVAISGIAGPSGGTTEKPVGTIWIAVGDRKRVVTRLLRANKDRLRNIQYAAFHALNQVRLFIKQS